MTLQLRLDIPGRLSPRHRHTYQAIFRLPTVHNLSWHEVQSLLDTLSEMSESGHDSYRAVRAGQEVTLHSPRHKDFATADELATLRRFLTQTAQPDPDGTTSSPDLPLG